MLLTAMLEAPRRWHYGYDLSKQTGLKSGTLYPLLMRLNKGGFLDSKWQEPQQPGKPPRHAYRLTAQGLALARRLQSEAPAGKLRTAYA
jgi:DNA-binding PadR family transcriptional regulator